MRNGVAGLLAPILDFVPGEHSPPPAPKHATAGAGKPKVPRQSGPGARKLLKVIPNSQQSHPSQQSQHSFQSHQSFQSQHSQVTDFDSTTNVSEQMMDEASIDGDTTIVSISPEEEALRQSVQMDALCRRRRFDHEEMSAHEHIWYGDALLDYFMLQGKPEGISISIRPPIPPQDFNVNRAIDDFGNTALHWAAAMGDLEICKDLLRRGANVQETNSTNGSTPLIHAVAYTNNFDKQVMAPLLVLLQDSLEVVDWHGASVLHHIVRAIDPVHSGLHKRKVLAARYYTNAILSKAEELFDERDRRLLIDRQDQDGNTAILLAAKAGERKAYRSLATRGADPSIANLEGKSAVDYKRMEERGRHNIMRLNSSSPVSAPAEDSHLPTFDILNAQSALTNGGLGESFSSQTVRSAQDSMKPLLHDVVKELTRTWEEEFNDLKDRQQECTKSLEEHERTLADLQEEARALDRDSRDGIDGAELAEEREVARLEDELEKELQAEQSWELSRLIAQEKNKLRIPVQRQQRESSDGMDDECLLTDEELLLKAELAQELAGLQEQTNLQIANVIGRSAIAGLGNGGAMYQALLAECLGLREGLVEEMMPSMLSDLEVLKKSHVATGA